MKFSKVSTSQNENCSEQGTLKFRGNAESQGIEEKKLKFFEVIIKPPVVSLNEKKIDTKVLSYFSSNWDTLRIRNLSK